MRLCPPLWPISVHFSSLPGEGVVVVLRLESVKNSNLLLLTGVRLPLTLSILLLSFAPTNPTQSVSAKVSNWKLSWKCFKVATDRDRYVWNQLYSNILKHQNFSVKTFQEMYPVRAGIEYYRNIPDTPDFQRWLPSNAKNE